MDDAFNLRSSQFKRGKMQMYSEEKRRKVQFDTDTL